MKNTFLDLGVTLSDKQLNQFEKYYQMLVEWNEKINLTAITEEKEVVIKHFYDSICVTKAYDFTDETICDIGSGAGFPGIPLKIMYPELKLTIVDSLNKRITFLDELCKELDIEAECVHARAEEYIKKKRDKYDIVFARAVARLNILSELCIPYCKVGGYFIAMKGSNALEEVRECNDAFNTLGGKLDKVIEYSLPESMGDRTLVRVQKVKNTNQKYPRIFGKIKKQPL